MTDTNLPRPFPHPSPHQQWPAAYQPAYGQLPGFTNPHYPPQQPGYPMQVNMFGASAPAKSPGVAALLAALFGPLGMLYSTVPGALVMMAVNFFVLLISMLTFGLGVILFLATWVCGIVWAYQTADNHNEASFPRFAAPYPSPRFAAAYPPPPLAPTPAAHPFQYPTPYSQQYTPPYPLPSIPQHPSA